jgi:pSer/pThr/pTyr-binding forkhead associated (FHA) protein
MSGILLLLLRLAMAIALYAFLGWAFYTLWRDLKLQSKLLSLQRTPEITLTQGTGDKASIDKFNQPEILVGRDASCDLILDEKTVSAEHARLSYHDGHWWVEDLRSRNGTYLNQDLLTSAVVLASGDILQLGQMVYEIQIGEVVHN